MLFDGNGDARDDVPNRDDASSVFLIHLSKDSLWTNKKWTSRRPVWRSTLHKGHRLTATGLSIRPITQQALMLHLMVLQSIPERQKILAKKEYKILEF